jgi:high-affinity K+ transport system ATPase subunit B
MEAGRAGASAGGAAQNQSLRGNLLIYIVGGLVSHVVRIRLIDMWLATLNLGVRSGYVF